MVRYVIQDMKESRKIRMDFHLRPHPTAGSAEDIEITGRIERRGNCLAFHLQLEAPPGEILFPARSDAPARRHGLWEETCFELFLGPKGSPGYWEYNLSPAGHWNVYRFSGYRLAMQEEKALASLPFTFLEDAGSLSAEFNLDGLAPEGQSLDAAVCTVLRLKQEEMSYWALAHFGPKPDFHRRESFLIGL